MKYDITCTDKKPCEICGEKKPGCRIVWQVDSFSRADDDMVGVTCKKDIQAFKEKHNIPREIYL